MKTLKTAYLETYGDGGLLGAMDILNKVLKLAKVSKADKAEAVSILPYNNGREQGFAIEVTRMHDCVRLSFSENRNSDDCATHIAKRVEIALKKA